MSLRIKHYLRIFGCSVFGLLSLLFFLMADYTRIVPLFFPPSLCGLIGGLFGFFSVFVMLRVGKLPERFVKAATLPVLVILVYFWFLRWHSGRELPRFVNAQSHCSSLFSSVRVLPSDMQNDLDRTVNSCYVFSFKEKLDAIQSFSSREAIFNQGTALLKREDRLDQTSFLVLLSTWTMVEMKKRKDLVKGSEPAQDLLKLDFDTIEGIISLMDFYDVKSFSSSHESWRVEDARFFKANELSSLSALVEKTDQSILQAESRYREIRNHLDADPKQAGESALLESRLAQMKTKFRLMLSHWNLAQRLNELHIEETYPAFYQSIKKASEISL